MGGGKLVRPQSSQGEESLDLVPRFRAARLEDYPQIAALESRSGLESSPRDQWEHLWVNNPAYKRVPGWPIGWVGENEKNEIICAFMHIPLTYQFAGREVTAATSRGLVADLRYRGKGLGARLARATLDQKLAEFVVISTANANSYKLLESVGFARVPTGEWGRSAFWITDYRGFLAGALAKKGYPRILSFPAASIMSLRDRVTKRISRSTPVLEQVEMCPSFDQRFAVFWEELKRAHPERLLATRSLEVLQWHFHFALAEKRLWILTMQDRSRIVAYAIFLRHDNPAFHLKRVRLVDFQALNEGAPVLGPMLLWGLSRCRQEGIHMLEAYGFRPEKQKVLDDLAPYDRALPSWAFYYGTRNQNLLAQLGNPAIWDPSHFDGDASI